MKGKKRGEEVRQKDEKRQNGKKRNKRQNDIKTK